MQWLVKRAIETKEEMGDLNRLFSVSQFNKQHTLPEDEAFQQTKGRSVDTLRNVKVSCYSDVIDGVIRVTTCLGWFEVDFYNFLIYTTSYIALDKITDRKSVV